MTLSKKSISGKSKETSHPHVLRFWRNGKEITLENIAPSRTLLQILREDLNSKGTKEGCAEGDCGACTVVVAQEQNNELVYTAVNSCIRMAHSVSGHAVWSVEDIISNDGTLHPAQSSMVKAHASQCGFCTPGFVMSLYAMYENYTKKNIAITPRIAQSALTGNLCRCTGYRPIIDAAVSMNQIEHSQSSQQNSKTILKALKDLKVSINEDWKKIKKGNPKAAASYALPQTLRELLHLKSEYPNAQLIAGSTDAGLQVTKQFKQFDHIIDLTQVSEIRAVEEYPHHIAIGAGVKLTHAFEELLKDRPQLKNYLMRFAGLPIRNSATLGGNIANGSPIGDSMPLLISLGASVVLSSIQNKKVKNREVLLENFYTGYRQSILTQREVITWIKVPKPHSNEILRAYKISKRFDDDISAVSLCINLSISNGKIAFASLGVGGVAATPAKAYETEKFLLDQPFNMNTLIKAKKILSKEFKPLSDMRASAGYRKQLLENLVQRFAVETLDTAQVQDKSSSGNDVFWMDLSSTDSNDLRFVKLKPDLSKSSSQDLK